MNIGDLVTRTSYNHDIPFLIEDIKEEKVLLSGLTHRLMADSTPGDLAPYKSIDRQQKTPCPPSEKDTNILVCANTRPFSSNLFGWRRIHPQIAAIRQNGTIQTNCTSSILHIDGNKRYLNESLAKYKRSGVSVIGFSIAEEKQPFYIYQLLYQYHPNILVITGHDSIKKTQAISSNLDSYLNSKYYVTSVKIARVYNNDPNELAIIAGGCQSNYEALMDAGANFASSPNRVLINVTEPVSIACKLAMTAPDTNLTIDTLADEIPSGTDGFGGIETRGQCKAPEC